MQDFNVYSIEDYMFVYDKALNADFKSLGYHENDLKQLGQDLVAYLRNTPPALKGDRIKKSNGAVKVRVSNSKSTRGSEDRLIYKYIARKYFVFMQIYNKSKKKDLSRREIKEINELVNLYESALSSRLSFNGIAVGGAVGMTVRSSILRKISEVNVSKREDIKLSSKDTDIKDSDIIDTFEYVDEIIVL